jgi:hypothetical protein
MAEEGFLRACLPAVGGVELLFLASLSSCSFEMAEVSQGLSCLVVSHQELLQRYLAQMYLQLSSKCRRQIYHHQPTHHSG